MWTTADVNAASACENIEADRNWYAYVNYAINASNNALSPIGHHIIIRNNVCPLSFGPFKEIYNNFQPRKLILKFQLPMVAIFV